ncbi:MAG TPA: GAF domain-containing protein [Anaerolineales bacterium]|nr:GAF domain-containing protein [Anaerolineales bacterium]
MKGEIRVLVVEQDNAYRNRLGAELAREGIQTETAAKPRDAVELLRAAKDRFDVVVWGRLGGNGIGSELISELQRWNPASEAILLTEPGEAPGNESTPQATAPFRVDRGAGGNIIASFVRAAVRLTAERQHTLGLQAMLSAAERVGESVDEEHLYQQLYHEASELLPGLDGFLIAHFDEHANEVSFPFSYSHGKRVHIKARSGGNSIAEYVLLTKEPLFLPYGDELFRMKNGLNPPDQNLGYSTSEIIVPMFLEGGKIYGAVFAASYNPATHFTVEHLQVLKTFIAQASIAIRNFIQIREANRLRDATAALAGQHGREAVLRAIIEGAHKIVNSDFTGLILQEEDGTLTKVQPVIPESYYKKFGVPRQTDGLTRAIIESRQPRKIPDTSKNPLVKESVRKAGIKSMLALPLIHRERVLGVLFTHTVTLRDFVARDVALWTAFATQAASALDRAIQEERQIQDYRRLVNELDNLVEPLSLKETLVRVATAAKRVFKSDSCRLFYIDPPTGNIVDTAWAEDDREEYHIEDMPRPDGSTYHVLQTKKPLYHPDMSDGPQPRNELLSAGLKSSATVPLSYGGRAIGVFHCNYFSNIPTYDDHFRTLIEAFGARAAVALSRVRRELRVGIWQGLAGEIINCPDTRQLYQLFTARAHQALMADFSVFFPYDPTTADAGRLPLEEDCVRIGEQTPWQQPKGGMGGNVFQYISRRAPIMIINDLDSHKGRYRSNLTEREGIKGFIALRLEVVQPGKRSSTLAGILFLNYRKVMNFEKNDLTGVRYASELIAAGILSLHLREDLHRAFEQRNRQLRAVIEIFRMQEAKSRNLNLNHIAQHAAQSLDLDICTILELDPISQTFTSRGHFGLIHPEFMNMNLRAKFKDAYVNLERPNIIPDVHKDPLMKTSRFVRRENVRSTVVCALRVEGESLGLLFGNYRKPTKPTKEHVEAIILFADVAAHAIHRANLETKYNDSQQKEERRRLLVWVSMVEDMWQHNLVQKASAIRNHAQTLLTRMNRHPHLPQAMDSVSETITDMDRLASDIVNAPPRVPHDSEMKSELVPIGSLLQEIVDRERQSMRLRGETLHRFEVNVKALGGIQVRGYRRWLIYMFESLLLNAYAAMPRGGQATITGTRQGKWVEIRICDTGTGVPKPLRDKIFKVAITGKNKHKGLGIGSLLVTTLVEENNGRIELEKPGPGDTTVLIRLPSAGGTEKK